MRCALVARHAAGCARCLRSDPAIGEEVGHQYAEAAYSLTSQRNTCLIAWGEAAC